MSLYCNKIFFYLICYVFINFELYHFFPTSFMTKSITTSTVVMNEYSIRVVYVHLVFL